MRRFIILLFLFGLVAAAQTSGVMPDWEVRDAAAAIEKHTTVIDGLLNQLRPSEWAAQGAPDLYVEQLKQAKQFNSYLSVQAQTFGRDPSKLTLALDVFFRLDHLQSLLDSLTAGTRKYQNAAIADLLFSAISQNSTARERLKEYTRQLALDREKEWEIANREAQRCRGSLAKRGPSTPSKKTVPAKP